MFLRFHHQTQENIDRCIEELKPFMTPGVIVIQRELTRSVSQFMLPENTTTHKNIEVVIDFKTKEEGAAFCENRTAFAIYQKYASGINGKEGEGNI
jgi:hypothetical protein